MQILQVDFVVHNHGDAASQDQFYIKLYWKEGTTKVIDLNKQPAQKNSYYRCEIKITEELPPLSILSKVHFGVHTGQKNGLRLVSLCTRALNVDGRLQAVAVMEGQDSSWIDAEQNPGVLYIKLKLLVPMVSSVAKIDYPDQELNIGGHVSQGLGYDSKLGWIISQRGDPKSPDENVSFTLNCVLLNKPKPFRIYQMQHETTHAQDIAVEPLEENKCRIYTIAPFGESNWYPGKAPKQEGIAAYILELNGRRRIWREQVWTSKQLLGPSSPGLSWFSPAITTDKKIITFAAINPESLEVYSITKKDLWDGKKAKLCGVFQRPSDWWLQGIAATPSNIFVLLGDSYRASPKFIVTFDFNPSNKEPVTITETKAGFCFVDKMRPKLTGGYKYWELEGLEIFQGQLWSVSNLPYTGIKALVCLGFIDAFLKK